ncbi:MAG TPA: 50S ribosomal protein L32 [Candidatus Mcinerneyibacteriales bacterium]|jgi:large subunit ribosomal protein L32|nr:50S ribosomal protein L32 [Candidatus Mcinerneyibacteriales bacterium]
MAVPKRKVSKQRKHKRRTHWKLFAPKLVKCEQCGAFKKPHTVCDECGTYKGKQIVVTGE